MSTYEVWWSDVNNDFPYELLYTDTYPFTFTFTVTNDTYPAQPLFPGFRYEFKYRAVNIFGPSLFSPVSLIYASCIPDVLPTPWTSLSNSTVTIQWDPTPNYHGQPVTAYKVQIMAKNGSFVEDWNICYGEKPTIVSAMKCTAAMSLFVTDLNLAIDDLIVVQISASNIIGYNSASPINTFGVTVKKPPQTAPYSLLRGANTNKTAIQIYWTGITSDSDTGGQAVDYIVYYDKATGGASWYTLTPSTANQTTWTDASSF